MTLPAPSRRQLLRRYVRQAHRWLGLLIAIQVLLWVMGGLIMSLLHLDAVRGEQVRARQDPVPIDPQGVLVPLSTVLQQPDATGTHSVSLSMLLGKPVYRLESNTGPRLVDATSGTPLSPLAEDAARAIAQADYSGDGAIAGIDWIDAAALEYRDRDLPLWRVRFDDDRDTTLYISPNTGQVVARRNDLWRLFDFVWMLHIMDYEGREDFNHPLLVAAAGTALLFVLTGLVMLFFSFRSRQAQGR